MNNGDSPTPAKAITAASSADGYRTRARRLPEYSLAAGFGALLLLMLVLIGVGIQHLGAAQGRLHRITHEHMRKIELAMRMRNAARERTLSLQNMLFLTDLFERDVQWMRFNELAVEFVEAREQFIHSALSDEESAALAEQGRLTGLAVPLQLRVADLISSGDLRSANRLLIEQAIPAQDRVFEQLAALQHLQERRADTAVKQAFHESQLTRTWLLLLGSGVFGLGIAIAIVVTRRVSAAEKALAREKERAHITLQTIGDAVVRVGNDGQIEYMNPAAERLLGATSDAARGRRFADVAHIVHDREHDPMRDIVAQALALGATVDGGNDLVLTAPGGNQRAIELVATPMRAAENAVSGAVLVLRDVTEVRALSRELVYQATHDSMTGLCNRREFEHRLGIALDGVRTFGTHSALCYFDLDLFKVVNDSCGHVAGDELLRQLAAMLTTRVRRGDTVARLGGDEFTVLLHNCTLEDATRLAEQLRGAIQDFRFVWEDKRFEIGASFGVVRIAADAGSANDVLRTADMACRVAKEDGRNRVYTLRQNDISIAKRQRDANWVQRIRRAIDEDQFVLYAQRIEPLAREQPSRALIEILIRLSDTTRQIIEPLAFIPAAERYHLMPMIDQWVIRRTFTRLKRHDWSHTPDLAGVTINLSGQSLSAPTTLRFILQQAEASGIEPNRICFEVTETAAVANLSSAVRLMTTLKNHGFRFALDDFGSGLSSFGYLKSMRVDLLKIDGIFIRGIIDDRADRAMVQSINQVAHIMEMKTVAEYVENDAIEDVVRELGIDYAQGAAVAVPEPLETILTRTASPKLGNTKG